MKIGILGGSFDPAHKGHLAISKEAKKRFKLKKIIWAVTKKNPFKAESKTPVSKKIKDCKKIIGLNSFIKVKFYENIIKSNKTIDLINYLQRNKNIEIFFSYLTFSKKEIDLSRFRSLAIFVIDKFSFNFELMNFEIVSILRLTKSFDN